MTDTDTRSLVERLHEDSELEVHRQESDRLIEANEQWFEQFEKDFKARMADD